MSEAYVEARLLRGRVLRHKHRLVVCVLGLAMAATAVLLRDAEIGGLGHSTPYMAVYPVVMLIAFYLGIGPGLVAAMAGLALTDAWLAGSLHASLLHADGILGAAVLLLSSGLLGHVGQTLRRERDRVATVLERVTDAFFALDPDWRFIYLNREAEVLLGSGRKLIGQYIWDCFPQAAGSEIHCNCKQAVQRQMPVHFESYYEPHGRWYEIRAYPDAKGLSVYFTDVTHRRKAEEALKRADEQLRAAAIAAHAVMFNLDLVSGKVRWSGDYAQVFGIDREQVELQEAVAGVHADDRERVQQRLAQCLAEQCDSLEEEFRFVRPNGTVVWVAGRGRILYSPEGKPTSMAGLCSDVTARHEAEDRLRESEERFRVLASSSFEGICISDNGFIRDCNDQFAHTLGYTRAELLGQAILGLFPERAWERIMAEIGQEDELTVDHEVLCKDGTRRHIEAHSRTVWDRGRPLRITVTRDITQRKKAEQKLRESREMFRAMGEAIDYGVWMCSADGQVEYVSESFLDLLGMTLEEVRAYGWAGRMSTEHAASISERWNRCLREGGLWEAEYCIRDHQGCMHTVLARGKPVRDEQGRITCWVGIHLDITDRERAERERQVLLEAERAARAEAERLNRIKDEFLATISHELRNPLNAILGWARLLVRGPLQDAAYGARIIERNATTLAQLVEDLLDMGRIVSGKIRLNLRNVEPEPLIRGVIESFQPALQAKRLTLNEEYVAPLGRIRCDPGRVQQILWNLLSNAVKFSPSGGTITVRARQADGILQIQVEDTGKGITAEFLPHVFGKFLQADASTTRQHGGLGLGLSIVKYLVELHGGTVHAHSDGEGRGARFSVDLPVLAAGLDASSEEEITSASADAGGGSTQVFPPGLAALVVDDDVEACELVDRVLSEAGVCVHRAHSVREALDVLFREKPDVLISDIGMPGEDGYSLIRQVRSAGGWCAHMACLAVTGMARPEDRERALAQGFDCHLGKPVDPAALIRSISELLMRSGLKTLETHKHTQPESVTPLVESATSSVGAVSSQPVHILLAEDHQAIAEMLEITLAGEGYSVSVADSVNEAIAIVRKRPIDLLLSDLRLRDGTGWDLMRRLRQVRLVPAIAMSGYSDKAYVEQSRSAGFADYLVKPLDEEVLLTAVRRVLADSRRLSAALETQSQSTTASTSAG
ncbi:MAG TPA: PAS domain S-box protein [Phycisphaerae bacterium]|nr:PAS domain S-box protein [Phycisphaerae bacterium]